MAPVILKQFWVGDYLVYLYDDGFTIFHGSAAEYTWYFALLWVFVPPMVLFLVWALALPTDLLPMVLAAGALLGAGAMFCGVTAAPRLSSVSFVLTGLGAAIAALAMLLCLGVWGFIRITTGKRDSEDDSSE